MTFLRTIALALLLGPLSGLPTIAQPRESVMSAWKPQVARVYCQLDEAHLPGSGLSPLHPECFGLSPRAWSSSGVSDAVFLIERNMQWILGQLRRFGFSSPYQLGTIVDDARTDAPEAVALHHSEGTSFAQAQTICGSRSVRGKTEVNLGALAGVASGFGAGMVAQLLAHEVAHFIQNRYPSYHDYGCLSLRPDKEAYLAAQWVFEGIADAIANTTAARIHPEIRPPANDRAGHSQAGLRRYDRPLHEHNLRPDPVQSKNHRYRTSSFWRHIVELWHDGNPKVLETYLKSSPPPYSPGATPNADWLRWLDSNLRSDPKIRVPLPSVPGLVGGGDVGVPLYVIYPAFLTYMAADWADGGTKRLAGHGARIGRAKWLRELFGGCVSVSLSPGTPYTEIDLEVWPMAGRCISVTVDGMPPDRLATVKTGAIVGSDRIADELHMGLAFTNDASGFNCAQFARRTEGPNYLRCLMEPTTGRIGSTTPARLWNASGLEHGGATGGQAPSAVSGGGVENVYVLSRVPPEPRLGQLYKALPAKVRMVFGLDVSTLEVDGQDVNSGGAHSDGRKRSTAGIGDESAELDPVIPASKGYIDTGNIMERAIGMSAIDEFGIQIGTSPFGHISLGEVKVMSVGGPHGAEPLEGVGSLEPQRVFSVFMVEDFPPGGTGAVKVQIVLDDPSLPENVFYTNHDDGSTVLLVEENSTNVFRAQLVARLCYLDWTNPTREQLNSCVQPIFVTGSVTKPLAWLYRPHSRLQSVETLGEQMYNAAIDLSVYREPHQPTPDPDPDTPADPPPGRGTGDGGGGSTAVHEPCDCSCTVDRARASPACQLSCAPLWSACPLNPSDPATQRAQAPAPSDLATRFEDLLDGRNLARPVREMLAEDFRMQPEPVQREIIDHYTGGGD